MNSNMQFLLTTHDITPHDACIAWQLPSAIVDADIRSFEIRLYKDGTYTTVQELNRAAYGPLVF